VSDDYVPERGDVVRLSFDPKVGREQAKRRPALVISPAAYNGKGLKLAIVCPITDGAKGYPFQVPIEGVDWVRGVVQADQIKSVDWQGRQAEKIGRLGEEFVLEVVGRQLALLDPNGEFAWGFETSE
jgi:mRNA interferase MazF